MLCLFKQQHLRKIVKGKKAEENLAWLSFEPVSLFTLILKFLTVAILHSPTGWCKKLSYLIFFIYSRSLKKKLHFSTDYLHMYKAWAWSTILCGPDSLLFLASSLPSCHGLTSSAMLSCSGLDHRETDGSAAVAGSSSHLSLESCWHASSRLSPQQTACFCLVWYSSP